jgi:murein DD-endopeptidase MepM/ murein hydrolase activator NlpD
MAQNTTTQPTVINAGKQVASLNDKATDAAPEAPAAAAAPKGDKVGSAAPQAATQGSDSSKLRWPVVGRVIAGFGGRPDGTHNDGINMSVPLGTEVHAAENGVVAYAGSELKGYGNLVLLRHDNGWVTAYAHNDELLVKRGDKVKRGQVIGKAGKTGTVDQPQVHFELRQGSKPVDPTPFMEKI